MAENVGNRVRIPVENLDAVLEDFNRIRLYKASTRTGSYSLLTTLTLATDDTAYEYQDTDGVSTDWYRWSYYHATTTLESAQSEPEPAAGALVVTRQTLRRMVAHELNMYALPEGDYTFPGPSGTSTATGAATTVVCDEFADSLYNESVQFVGHHLLLNSGTYANEVRRIASLTKASGTFTLARALAGASGSGVTFDIYAQRPPAWWNHQLFGEGAGAHLAVNVPFRFPIVGRRPSSTEGLETEFRLPYYVESRDQVIRVTLKRGTVLASSELSPESDYELIAEEGGGVTLYRPGGFAENEVYLVEGYRHLAPLGADTETVTLSELQQRLLIVAAAVNVLSALMQQPNLGETDASWEPLLKKKEEERGRLITENNLWVEMANPRPGPMVAAGGGYGGFTRFSRYLS